MMLANRVWLAAVIALAVACVGLGRQIRIERDHARTDLDYISRLQARISALKGGEIERQASAVVAASPGTAASASPAITASDAPPSPANARRADPNIEESRELRATLGMNARMLADPERRRLLLADTKVSLRERNPDVGRRLNLTADEADQLMGLLAEQLLRGWERRANGTSSPLFSAEGFEQNKRTEETEIAALIGSERFQLYQPYVQTPTERRRVNAFRQQLDEANALSDDTAEQLITALATEHQRAEKAFEQSNAGGERNGMFTGFPGGASVYLEPSSGDPIASARAQLESHYRKTEQLAAPLLTSAQLKSFAEFQSARKESELVRLRSMLAEHASYRQPGAAQH